MFYMYIFLFFYVHELFVHLRNSENTLQVKIQCEKKKSRGLFFSREEHVSVRQSIFLFFLPLLLFLGLSCPLQCCEEYRVRLVLGLKV